MTQREIDHLADIASIAAAKPNTHPTPLVALARRDNSRIAAQPNNRRHAKRIARLAAKFDKCSPHARG